MIKKTTAQKRKEAREARAADPYAYQHSQQKAQRKQRPRRPAPMYIRHRDVVVEEARAQLYAYVDKWPDYNDRPRDILLLKIFDMLEELTGK